VWTCLVFVGVFIASVPSVFGLEQNGAFKFQSTGIWKWLWSVIFLVSFAPAAVMNVVGENLMKDVSHVSPYERRRDSDEHLYEVQDNDLEPADRVNQGDGVELDSVVAFNPQRADTVNLWFFLFMESIWQEITFILFFWVDALPDFGTPPINNPNASPNISGVFSNLKQDWRYFLGEDGAPVDCTVRALVFVGCYTVSYIGTGLMLRYTEGATWNSIIAALNTPISAIFWLFFEIDRNSKFRADIHWDNSDIAVIVGVTFMAPFMYLYNQEAVKEEAKKKGAERIMSPESEDPYVAY